MASNGIIINAARFVIVKNILQSDVIQVIRNNLAQSLPQRQRDAFIAAFAAYRVKVQTGYWRKVAFCQAQDAADSILTRCVDQTVTALKATIGLQKV